MATIWGSSPWAGRPALTHDLDVDVAVVGGGMAGMATAYALARTNSCSIALLEAHRVGGGTTGRSTGKPVRIHGTRASEIAGRHGAASTAARDYLHACRAAHSALLEWIDVERFACDLRIRDHVLWATSRAGAARLDAERDLLHALGETDVELRATAQVEGLPPAACRALMVRGEALVDPVLFVRGLADALSARGVHVHEHSPVVEMRHGRGVQGGVELHVEGGAVVRARRVVLATHVPVFDPSLAFASFGYRRATCLAFAAREAVALATPVDEGGISMRPVTMPDGTRLAVVAGGGRALSDGPDEPGARERLEAHARRLIPHLGALRAAWDAHDPFPGDHRPCIGAVDHDRRVFVVTGFGGWGLLGGIAAGLTIAGLIHRGHSTWADLFAPSRASMWLQPTVAKSGAHVGGAWLGDRIAARRKRRAPAAGVGSDARVVHTDAGPVAVARDADGVLHTVSARCTHLGCLVRHNAADGTWDCPCHGSRFALDGSVLEGPASTPLHHVDVDVEPRVDREVRL